MQKTPELARLLEGRGNLYRFLSRFYLVEVDEAFWTALRGMTFPETADEPRMAEGWQRLNARRRLRAHRPLRGRERGRRLPDRIGLHESRAPRHAGRLGGGLPHLPRSGL